jgi:hypothetical protein
MLQTPLRPEIHRSPVDWSDTRRLQITAILKPSDLRQMSMPAAIDTELIRSRLNPLP